MGPLLLAGLVLFGAAAAIATIAAQPPWPGKSTAAERDIRSYAVVSMAFPGGLAILAVVVALFGVYLGRVPEPWAWGFLVGPAAAGVAIGVAQILRAPGDLDRQVTITGFGWLVGIALLAGTVATLSVLIPSNEDFAVETWPYAVLGTIVALNALALGLVGARGLRAISAVDDSSARTIMSRQFSRAVPYGLLGAAASLAAMVLVIVGRP